MTDRRDAAAAMLGVVMLRTRFPRLAGEIGNPASFPFPTVYRTVDAATVARVVTDGELDAGLADAVIAAGHELVGAGATVVATSCGFLSPLQDRLANELGVAVVASSLVVLPFLRRIYGDDPPLGVMTFDSRRLSARHLPVGAGDVVIEGLEPDTELYRAVAEDRPSFDVDRARRETVARAERLVARRPEMPAVVFECTNLSPYRAAVAERIGRPVYDINQAVQWSVGALGPAASAPVPLRPEMR